MASVMGGGGGITVRFDNMEEIQDELRTLAEMSDQFGEIELGMDASQGPARDRLVEIGEALSSAAQETAAMIRRTAVKVDEANKKYREADQRAAGNISRGKAY